jgi:hypothetical protein
MKAVKRLFKRKKKQSPENLSVPSTGTRTTGAAAGLESGRKPPSQQTPRRSENPTPTGISAPSRQNQEPAKAPLPTENASMKSSSKNNLSRTPSREKEPQDFKVQSNGRAPPAEKPSAPETAKTVEKSKAGGSQSDSPVKTTTDASQTPTSKKKHKGVSESFKGLTVTQRFDVKDSKSSDAQVGNAGETYDMIPLLEQTKLPRGGISIETKAVGRVQVCFLWN